MEPDNPEQKLLNNTSLPGTSDRGKSLALNMKDSEIITSPAAQLEEPEKFGVVADEVKLNEEAK